MKEDEADRFAVVTYVEWELEPRRDYIEVCKVFGFQPVKEGKNADSYGEFNVWHSNNWPKSKLAHLIGPDFWAFIKIKAVQMGRT